MDTKQFLNTVLGDNGYYCVAGKKKEGPMNQQFYDSLDSVIGAASNFDKEGHDVYFALASFVDKNRKANNVRSLKSLFLDIDCGIAKHYQTQAEALKALRTFRKAYTLPRPFIINSGRGLHVYWALNKSYSRDEWEPVAQTLKATCLQDGLKIDAGVTADAARLLRVPDTRNFKGAQPLPVAVVSEGEAGVELEQFAGKLPVTLIPVPSSSNSSKEDLEDMERAKGYAKHRYKFKNLIVKLKAGVGCAHFERAVLTPNELTYPEWLHVLSIAKRCDKDGVAEGVLPAIHLISRLADAYDPEETQKISDSINDPHTCVRFDEEYPNLCDECPHKGVIKSPVALCREAALAEGDTQIIQLPVENKITKVEGESVGVVEVKKKELKIPEYPPLYERPKGGGVLKISTDEKGDIKEEFILDDTLYLSKRMIEGEVPSYEIRHITPHEGERSFLATQAELTARESFRTVMNSHDVLVMSDKIKGSMDYVGAWMKKLRDAGPATHVKTQFGWTEFHKSFVLGDREIFANTTKENPAGVRTAQYIPLFKAKGTLEKWKELASFYGQEGFEQHQYMFGLAFGSPLMEFISGVHGAIYNLTSTETGIGKTTGMWGGASVWGNHKHLVLIGKDTDNSAWNRAEIMKNLPLYVDEVSNFKGEQASDFCYSISDGVQKNRLTNEGQNKERFRGDVWDLSCGTTGNSSLIQIASGYRSSPKGEAGRVVSVTAKKLLKGVDDTLRANELNDKLAANYGWAGPIFIQHVLKNLGAVEKLVHDTRTEMVKELKSEPQDRFWVAQGATTYAGCVVAHEIGLIDWKLQPLWDWIIHTILTQKHGLQEMDMVISDVVAQFYMDNARGILRITSSADGRDPNVEEAYEHVEFQDNPNYKFIARHETDTNKFYIRIVPFKEWCGKHRYEFNTVKNLIVRQMNGKPVKKHMGKGTAYKMGVAHVLECTLDNGFDSETGSLNEAKSE